MKKRIRELAKQAKAEIRSEEEIEGVAYDNFDEQVMKKFAELIVKECALLANRTENSDTETRCMYDVITEHFGVK